MTTARCIARRAYLHDTPAICRLVVYMVGKREDGSPPFSCVVFRCFASVRGDFRPLGDEVLLPTAAITCCGAQNFCAALRRTLKILTAATRSLRFLCHRQRSVRSPHRPAHRTTNNASVGRRALTPPHWCGGLSNSGLRAARPTQAFQHFRRGGRLCPPVLRRGNLRLPQSKFFRQFSSRCTPGCG